MSLSTIIQKIDAEAEASHQKILEQANAEAGRILEQARVDAEQEAANIHQHADDDLQSFSQKQTAAAAHDMLATWGVMHFDAAEGGRRLPASICHHSARALSGNSSGHHHRQK